MKIFGWLLITIVSLPAFAQTPSPSAGMQYPDGLSSITPVITRISQAAPFTVPAGQNFYINNVPKASLCGPRGGYCFLTAPGGSNLLPAFAFVHMSCPILVGPQQVLSSTSSVISFDVQGFLIPATVPVVITDLAPSASYAVPAGQNLYLLNTGITDLLAKNSLTVDGVEITQFGNIFNSAGPIIVSGGHAIKNQGTVTITLDGYLKSQ